MPRSSEEDINEIPFSPYWHTWPCPSTRNPTPWFIKIASFGRPFFFHHCYSFVLSALYPAIKKIILMKKIILWLWLRLPKLPLPMVYLDYIYSIEKSSYCVRDKISVLKHREYAQYLWTILFVWLVFWKIIYSIITYSLEKRNSFSMNINLSPMCVIVSVNIMR